MHRLRQRWWVAIIALVLVAGALAFRALTAPLAVSASVNGDQELPFVGASIVLRFNHDMNVQSVRNSFQIDPAVPFAVSIEGSRVFALRPQLEPDTAYQLRLRVARKAFGLGEVRNYAVRFRTEAAPKVTEAVYNNAPLVDGQQAVAPRGTLRLDFSQPMDTNATTLTLNGTPLDSTTLQWDASGRWLTASLNLGHSRTHVLSVPEGAKNRRRDPTLAPWIVRFSTMIQVPSAGRAERIGASGAPVIVQIENSDQPTVRPQAGMQAADMVYEYISEYGIPRLSAVYWHPLSTLVGPVRSCRLITVQLEQMYRGMVYCSGANDYILGQVWKHPSVVYDYSYWLPYMFRTGDRAAPHNVMARPGPVNQHTAEAQLPALPYDIAPAHADAPLPGAEPAPVVSVPIHDSVWRYDAASKEYRKWQDGAPLKDADAGQVHAKNVIVQRVKSRLDTSPGNSFHGYFTEYYELAGEGAADICSLGSVVHATWRHPDPNLPAVYYTPNGEPIELNTGLTWVHVIGTNQ